MTSHPMRPSRSRPPEPELEPPEPELEPADDESEPDSRFEPLDVSPADDLDPLALFRRSILAQPEPLKCTAGATITLRIAPPQTGQASGPEAVTECMTSIRWPHSRQT